MKFYIATSTSRIEDHHKVRDLLVEHGHTLTYDWTTHGRLTDVTEEVMQTVCMDEVEGVAQADFVVVLLPGGKGTHGEVGMAAIAKKPTFIHSADPARFDPSSDAWCGTTFYYHDRAERIVLPTVEEFAFRVAQRVGKHGRKIKRPGFHNISAEGFAFLWHDEWYDVMQNTDGADMPLFWDDLSDGARKVLIETSNRVLSRLR